MCNQEFEKQGKVSNANQSRRGVRFSRGARCSATTRVQRRSRDMSGNKRVSSFGNVVNCPFCVGQASYCNECAAKFRQAVPEQLLETIAFGEREDVIESKELFEAIQAKVDQQKALNIKLEENNNGISPITHRQRQETEVRVRRGCEIDAIAANLLQNERSGLLMSPSPLDAMPQDYVQYLASIDDEMRNWLRDHNSRIHNRQNAYSTPAIDAIAAEDKRIDLANTDQNYCKNNFPGFHLGDGGHPENALPSEKRLIGIPRAVARLPPNLLSAHKRIQAKADLILQSRVTKANS